MSQGWVAVGAGLRTRFCCLAASAHDIGHAHTHIILRGRRANGQDLIPPRDFIRRRLREIARDVATSGLGHRTPGRECEALERETPATPRRASTD